MDDVDDELRATWEGLDLPERELLVRLATGTPTFSRGPGGARGGGITRAIEGLVARGVITDGASGVRGVVDPLFAEWLRSQRATP
jgi:hypothetical protein